jgi:hypothetical protein
MKITTSVPAGRLGFDPRRAKRDFSLRQGFQTSCGAHPVSYSLGVGGSFPGVKRPGREADFSPPSSTEFKNTWSYTLIPPYMFMDPLEDLVVDGRIILEWILGN